MSTNHPDIKRQFLLKKLIIDVSSKVLVFFSFSPIVPNVGVTGQEKADVVAYDV
jgi:hypothetical protein